MCLCCLLCLLCCAVCCACFALLAVVALLAVIAVLVLLALHQSPQDVVYNGCWRKALYKFPPEGVLRVRFMPASSASMREELAKGWLTVLR